MEQYFVSFSFDQNNNTGTSSSATALTMKHSRDEDIASLTARRDAARKAKNWALADSLRDELNSRGVQLQDRSVASSSGPGSVVIDREKEEAKRRKKKAKKERKMLAAHEAHMQRRTAADDDAAEPDGGGAGEGGEVQERVLAKNVRVLDLKEGKGPVLEDRKKVHVRYVGRLWNGGANGSLRAAEAAKGNIFDRSNSFAFRLGRGEVIDGWDIGVRGMRSGGKRRIVCPPAAAYGNASQKGIPKNSTLCFDITAM